MAESVSVGQVYAHTNGSVWTVVKAHPITLESVTREQYRRPAPITLARSYRRILR